MVPRGGHAAVPVRGPRRDRGVAPRPIPEAPPQSEKGCGRVHLRSPPRHLGCARLLHNHPEGRLAPVLWGGQLLLLLRQAVDQGAPLRAGTSAGPRLPRDLQARGEGEGGHAAAQGEDALVGLDGPVLRQRRHPLPPGLPHRHLLQHRRPHPARDHHPLCGLVEGRDHRVQHRQVPGLGPRPLCAGAAHLPREAQARDRAPRWPHLGPARQAHLWRLPHPHALPSGPPDLDGCHHCVLPHVPHAGNVAGVHGGELLLGRHPPSRRGGAVRQPAEARFHCRQVQSKEIVCRAGPRRSEEEEDGRPTETGGHREPKDGEVDQRVYAKERGLDKKQ
mmetsp:Transcript_773/g.2998  ORF Transcript_773/g.2998 Transcript_773/m.2998 type:complete len:333 (+) Transcript_773:1635-2633(+)